MTAPVEERFRCDVLEEKDGQNRSYMRVVGYGRLVAGDTEGLRSAVQPLIIKGGRTVIDCSNITYVDSMGLGALVALKVSSVHKGFGTLEYVNLSPRVKELLRLTKLTEYLSRPDSINYGG